MRKGLRLLLVEDSPTDAKLVVQQLRSAGHEVDFERVEDEPGFNAALESGGYDAVLCDWSMPRFSAGAALALIKKRQLDLPFIIVSGTVGEEAAVDAMRAGAHDYVLKDRLSRLPAVLERELRERELREVNRQNEAALEASEARFAHLAESGIIGIVVSDRDGQLREANDTFLSLVGHERAELRGGAMAWGALLPPEELELKRRADAELDSSGVMRPYETAFCRPDGTLVPVLIGAARQGVSLSIAFIVDRSAQKRVELELQKSVEQLRQSQKMEAVGRLAGGVAHDFNNLLSVILSYASMITHDLPEGDPIREDVAEIHKAGLRAAALTKQLLMFSRQQVVETRLLDLDALLQRMSSMLERVLGEDVDFTLSCGATSGAVRADATNLEQVVMNLVVNARDAMPTGGRLSIETRDIELDEGHVRSHFGAKAGPYVMLAVTDSGVGMDASTQARIFEPFFTTKDKGKGTGLGLSTVFGIVQQCGGAIWVYSEPGHGTTFKVYLPRVAMGAEEPVARPLPAQLRGTECLLLVEDEGQVRHVARVILEGLGYRVIEAAGAAEALQALQDPTLEVDLLLTDVVMPKMSGPELARQVWLRRPKMRVLCMSGYTDDAVVRHGALADGMPYLQKPITPDTLAAKVRAVLDAP